MINEFDNRSNILAVNEIIKDNWLPDNLSNDFRHKAAHGGLWR